MRKIIAICTIAFFYISCGGETEPVQGFGTPISEDAVFWTGPDIIFTLGDNSDHRTADNQDRLTDNVIITRSVIGGQIFNFVTETAATSSISPEGTEWAIGSIADVENLSFAPFRETVGDPRDRVVGLDLVLHLIEDDIFIDVTFISWSRERSGGFSYIRSTP